MPAPVRVRLEIGAKRCFAEALDWPGWCRAGRDPETALAALAAYGERYAAAVGDVGGGVPLPLADGDLAVVERVPGTATTDFGAPDTPAQGDPAPLPAEELDRQLAVLCACWQALEEAEVTCREPLRPGPRGGGRTLDGIVAHVHEATRADLSRAGVRTAKLDPGDGEERARLQAAYLVGARRLAEGGAPDMGRSKKEPTPLRTLIRRTAWHVLDHAWEIQDRAAPSQDRGAGPSASG